MKGSIDMKYTLVKNRLYDAACNGLVGSNNLQELIKEAERYVIPVEIWEKDEQTGGSFGKLIWTNSL
jgi:hypothetical protein